MTSSSRRLPWGWIALGVFVLLALWCLSAYNGLVASKELVTAQWSQVETQYQRRFDLVPNLVNTVKGSAVFEQTTLQGVTEARTKWMQSSDRAQRIDAAQQLDATVSKLLVTVEAYPQLRSTEAFRDLLAQLEGTENRISVARRDFNSAVQAYNIRVKTFPVNLFARTVGFGPEKFFEADKSSETAPSVTF